MTPLRVLIIDDDEAALTTMRYMLEDAGYTVATRDRSVSILQAVQEEEPALVILDYMQPELTGGDAAVLLRHRGYTVPILFVTGLPVTLDSLHGHKLLTKPVDMDAFVATVRALIGPAQ